MQQQHQQQFCISFSGLVRIGASKGAYRRPVAKHFLSLEQGTNDHASSKSYAIRLVEHVRPLRAEGSDADVSGLRIFMLGAMASIITCLPFHSIAAGAFPEGPLDIVSRSITYPCTSQQELDTGFCLDLREWQKKLECENGRTGIVSKRHDFPKYSVSNHQSLEKIFGERFGEGYRTDYEQIIQEHDDLNQKRDMFTGDAWMGMMRLQKYNDLLDALEEKEKLCGDCIRNRRLLEQVWQTVSNEYFDQYGRFSQAEWAGYLFETLDKAGGLLHSKAETYRAAKSMVSSLEDRYSSFLTPEEYRIALHRPIQSELKYLAYQYTGVGMEIGKRHPEGGFEIIAPFAGSPAEEVGILGGERLLSVDDLSVDSLTADEAVTLLRGPIGSLVELEVIDAKPSAISHRLVLERRALPLPPLRMQMVNAKNGRLIAYMRLHYFSHNATKAMASAIREGESLGVDGYVLDLRNNPGGVYEEAIAMAALWLDCTHCSISETVRTVGYDVDDFTYIAGELPETIFLRHPGVLTHAPLVIISNKNSASASEVLIGALHDNGRSIVLGEKTFGKGVVQYYFPMDDGSGLKLTVAKYLTPKRYDISKQGGLVPDKFCSDYPHAKGIFDKCITQAVADVQDIIDKQQKEYIRKGLRIFSPMPYRWLPLDEGRLHSKGTY
ncbi:hypothetical protein KP509_16G008500 [Ceratopteris richardii]|uniref:PDZ domain-containing protein n=2 Tax=Ceratopteris richardii TaxID=49495 RepID=A0A8T2SWI3_CERRI|nr:hypothetical protein KP509_16G008500 [Ceratopteris richardii]